MTTETELLKRRTMPGYTFKQGHVINDKVSMYLFKHDASGEMIVALDHFLHSELILFTQGTFKKMFKVLKQKRVTK